VFLLFKTGEKEQKKKKTRNIKGKNSLSVPASGVSQRLSAIKSYFKGHSLNIMGILSTGSVLVGTKRQS
jgi:hypothetical protein